MFLKDLFYLCLKGRVTHQKKPEGGSPSADSLLEWPQQPKLKSGTWSFFLVCNMEAGAQAPETSSTVFSGFLRVMNPRRGARTWTSAHTGFGLNKCKFSVLCHNTSPSIPLFFRLFEVFPNLLSDILNSDSYLLCCILACHSLCNHMRHFWSCGLFEWQEYFSVETKENASVNQKSKTSLC